jgi:hypothetical protein
MGQESSLDWLPRYTAERAEVEDMAVAGRQSKGSTTRLRNIVDQVMASGSPTPPWLEQIDALWSVYELPDEAPDTPGQASLFGMDGHVELPTDVRFGDGWVRFDTEGQAHYVRTLAALRMAPRRIAVPPGEVAHTTNQTVIQFIETKQSEFRDALAERIDRADPGYADPYVQALTRLAAAVRTALHAST